MVLPVVAECVVEIEIDGLPVGFRKRVAVRLSEVVQTVDDVALVPRTPSLRIVGSVRVVIIYNHKHVVIADWSDSGTTRGWSRSATRVPRVHQARATGKSHGQEQRTHRKQRFPHLNFLSF